MKFKISPIAGDASFRKFYRITLNNNNKIIILAKKNKYNNLVAYLAINKFLKANKIYTPKIYSHNYSNGIVVMEDFGNLTFNKILSKKKNKLSTYKELVDLLIKIQKIRPKFLIKNILGKHHVINKYSNKYLHKETDLFFDWYLPLFFKKKKILTIKKKIKKILSKLYNSLNFSNSYFVHRDYHAQNLMRVGNKIGVIDTQDALIGNPTYDLVSLIDDVRIKTSKELKTQIYNYYLKNTSQVYRNNSEKFLRDFNILSIQRNLKIIGIFSRLYKRDKKKKYLKFIPYTWQLIEMRMGSAFFMELRKILDTNISKKIRKRVLL